MAESSGKSGGGPDDPTRLEQVTVRSQGFLMIAFGIALGLTLMILFGVFRQFPSLVTDFEDLHKWVTTASINPNLWMSFVIGFVAGTLLSGIYNILVVRRLNLLGLESALD